MANLAIVGTHSTNGVAAIHSELLRTHDVRDLAEMFPERFNNKTNGVTPRRWLLLANPRWPARSPRRSAMAGSPTSASSPGSRRWPTTRRFRDAFRNAKREAKERFADWLKATTGQTVDPDTIFDSQVKRIHEYKRQLLNALRIVVLYNRLRRESRPRHGAADVLLRRQGGARPTTWPSSSSSSSTTGAHDRRRPGVRGRLKVVFLPDYCVTLAERLIPPATSPTRSRRPATRPAARAT
jgi:glycogen phosphorylase